MKHLGLVCPELSGHLNPMLTLGGELRRRGHHVTLLGGLDAQAAAEVRGLDFRGIGESAFPLGSTTALTGELGLLRGRAATRRTFTLLHDAARVHLRELPHILRSASVDALLVDQVSSAAGTAAEIAGVPYISVANALAANMDLAVPPVISGRGFRDTRLARLRNGLDYLGLYGLVRPLMKTINARRREAGLRPFPVGREPYSSLAQIAQQPACFDYPRQLPACFHYTGPFHEPERDREVEFPWERLDGRPLVYASMGTLQNRLGALYMTIVEACAPLDVQLVLSLGGADIELPDELPGAPVVVRFAPQLQLLDRAALAISHAGLNTALECLARGVPMVAIPIANDQPAVAARVGWVGAGVVVPLRGIEPSKLSRAIGEVLATPAYRDAADRMRQAIAAADGLRSAADLVERTLAEAGG